MKPFLALLIALLAGPAAAEIAVVRGGEHPAFTRLVVSAALPGAWQLGRIDGGYALELGPAVTGYDLTDAFSRIPRARISALWRDPASGRLFLSVPCACHAIAFDARAGLVVIDIRPGPPPPGTAFELPLDPGPPLRPPVAPAAPVLDWIARRGDVAAGDPRPGVGMTDARLGPLRAALLAQISRGAAAGIVGIAEGRLPSTATDGPKGDAPGIRVGLGELPGIAAGTVRDPGPNLTADGAPCIADDRVDVAGWLPEGPVAGLIGPARGQLLGEFDTPDREAVLAAARFHLALGFGAEARMLLSLLPPDTDAETALLRAMADVTDLGPGGAAVFAGMAACDTAAALWSALVLAASGDAPQSAILSLNRDAVARGFSALPAHLRRHFGPPLVTLFLGAGAADAARRIRDAALRAPGGADAGIRLMDARFLVATGDPGAGAAVAAALWREGGSDAALALAVLAEAAFAGGTPLPEGAAASLRAHLDQAQGTADAPALARAAVLAAAIEGDFDAAFALPGASPATMADLWSRAAAGAPDGLFLAMAVSSAPLPPVAPDTALAVARRLEALGFADAALAWLGAARTVPATAADAGVDDGHRLLAAQALLALRDARGALGQIAALEGSDAERIRAEALLQLGDPAGAAAAFARAGNPAARERAAIWASDWPHVAGSDDPRWRELAGLVAVPGGADHAAAPADPAGAAVPGSPEIPQDQPAAPSPGPTAAPAGERAAEPLAQARDGSLAAAASLAEDAETARRAVADLLGSLGTTGPP